MKRPISVTIIALWVFLGAVVDFRTVAFEPVRLHFITILGVHLHRYAALSAYLFLISVATFIGVGLLDLRTSARTAGMIFTVFLMFNGLITFLLPGSFDRFAIWAERQDPAGILTAAALHTLHAVSVTTSVCIPAIVLYFLWTRHWAFRGPAETVSNAAIGSPEEGDAP